MYSLVISSALEYLDKRNVLSVRHELEKLDKARGTDDIHPRVCEGPAEASLKQQQSSWSAQWWWKRRFQQAGKEKITEGKENRCEQRELQTSQACCGTQKGSVMNYS